MGLNKRRPKFMKLRRTMKAQSPKKKEKERNNKEKKRGSRSEDMQQGSRARPETCSKDLGQARGYAARRINIKALCMFRFLAKMPLKIQQNPVKELGQDT